MSQLAKNLIIKNQPDSQVETLQKLGSWHAFTIQSFFERNSHRNTHHKTVGALQTR